MKTPEDVINRFINEENVKFNQERDDWMIEAMEEYAKLYHESKVKKLNIPAVSGLVCDSFRVRKNENEAKLMMQEFAEQQAIDFADWINKNAFSYTESIGTAMEIEKEGNWRWSENINDEITTKELYEIFLEADPTREL